MMDSNETRQEIKALLKKRNAVLLAHNYMRDEVQEIADITGDSLALSIEAAKTAADVIVFCGVHFMAESASILSPDKTVLLPRLDAGCPMADMVTAGELRKFRSEHADIRIVCYVNTSAEVKAECDLCVTSANAVNVLRNYPFDKFLFVPDRNLGRFVKDQVREKEIMLWDGYCHVHVRFALSEIKRLKEEHPNALLLIHPECEPEILREADQVLSTNQMVRFVRESKASEFFIGTEEGILYRIQKENPGKSIRPAGPAAVCPNMKKTRLSDLRNSLKYGQYEITLPEEIMKKARKSLDEMLRYS
jgi:quinolinate synthase